MTVQRIVGFWLAFAVVLTGATQLRLPGLPVGTGEILLVGWIPFVGFLLLRGTVVMGPTFRALLLYWLVAFALLGLGAVMGVAKSLQDPESAGHDGLAFVLAAVVTCFAALRWRGGGAETFPLQLARQTFFICTTITTALLVIAHITPTLGAATLWYASIRFRGWALNPNQMALFAVAMPFLGWYLIEQTRGHLRKAAYLAAIAGAVAVGLTTLSDALRVGWAGALCAVGGLLWLRAIIQGRGRFLFVPYILVPFGVISFGAILGDDILLKIESGFQRMYGEGDQGDERLTLWWYGIDTILRSPVVGIGPGRPGAGPLQGGEAHNSLIDWGMATGISGIVLHVGLLAWCGVRTLRAGLLPLFGIVVALAAFSLLHYTLRQPIYWLVLVLVLVLAERRFAVGVARSRTAPTPSFGGEAGRSKRVRELPPDDCPRP